MTSVQPTTCIALSSVSYPRTGKRGVPQQFARRLYEMLQSEAKRASESPQDEVVIKWSDSGLAFRILDVKEFTSLVLPKWFKTKKFSSFQRNLNLYGFTKVRRGPDTDMYAHPSFVRGKPELLSHLRKCTPAGSRKKTARSVSDESDASSSSGSYDSPQSAMPITPPLTIAEPLDLTKPAAASWQNFHSTPLLPKTTCQPQTIGRLDLLALAVEHAA